MFDVIGEKTNASRELIREVVSKRNQDYIVDDVKKQILAGVNFIYVNADARIGHELEDMKWLLEIIQPIATIPLCLDSSEFKVLEMAYDMANNPPIINYISLEKDRFKKMMSFLKGKTCKIIASCMDDEGIPISSYDIITRAQKLIKALEDLGMKQSDIYVDPLVQSINVDTSNGTMVLNAVRQIKLHHPNIHIIADFSNISDGLPERKVINRIFIALMMEVGMDSAILNPLDIKTMAHIKIADMLLGKDDFCMNFLRSVRSGTI